VKAIRWKGGNRLYHIHVDRSYDKKEC